MNRLTKPLIVVLGVVGIVGVNIVLAWALNGDVL